jgi:putative nucleotidyltransferase with HDIG domain
MNGQYVSLFLALGALVVVTLTLNDLLVALVRSDEYNQAGYLIHLIAAASLLFSVIYLLHQLYFTKQRLMVYRAGLGKLPCNIAIYKKGKVLEIGGGANLAGLCGLGKGVANYRGAADIKIMAEDHHINGETRYLERIIIPLPGINGGSYIFELLLDISDKVKRARQRESEYDKMLKIMVNMFEINDPYSHGHSEVVTSLAQELAKTIGLPKEEIYLITKAAMLHDIGKIIIPSEVAGKKGDLSFSEYEIIKNHASVGADILAGIGVFQEIADVVRFHHERFDGGGYPVGLAGEQIPLGSRIIAVADAFEAITAGRIKEKRDVAATLEILAAERGKQFDPAIVDAFIDMVQDSRKEEG